MTAIVHAENLRPCKNWISLIVEQIIAFGSSVNIEKWKISPQISNKLRDHIFLLLYVLIRIDKSILSLTFKQFNQTLYLNSLSIVDITCYFW